MSGLKEFLLQALSGLPDSRTFHLYTLVSAAIRDPELFGYTEHRPRSYVRHFLVLLAQQPLDAPENRVFVCAVEAYLYTIPSTSSSILYISKVDSSGHGGVRPNPTRPLLVSFLRYFTDASTRPLPNIWLHVFARSQNQYLFPNSSSHPKKRVLRDAQLCKWWKQVIEEAAATTEPSGVRLYYLFPGYSAFEATAMIETSLAASSKAKTLTWQYSHPYSQSDIPMPWGPLSSSSGSYSIAQLIPSFLDDPKARFLDEIASTPTQGRESRPIFPTSPRQTKKPRIDHKLSSSSSLTSSASGIDLSKKDVSGSTGKRKSEPSMVTPAVMNALKAVSVEEFWERMAFRQECSQAAVTGFFTAVFVTPTKPNIFRGESMRGLLPSSDASSGVVGISLPNKASPSQASTPSMATVEEATTGALSRSPLRPLCCHPFSLDDPFPGQISVVILDRIIATLLNHDFGSADRAIRSTSLLENTISSLCGGPGTRSRMDAGGSEDGAAGVSGEVTLNAGLGDHEEEISDVVRRRASDSLTIAGSEDGKARPSSLSQSDNGINSTDSSIIRSRDNSSSSQDMNVTLTKSEFETHILGIIKVSNPPLAVAQNANSNTPASTSIFAGPVTELLVKKKRKGPPTS